MATTVDTELYEKVQDAVARAVREEGADAGPLAQAVITGQDAHSLPQSCMGPYLDKINCGRPLTEAQRCAALKAFESVTGYQPFDLTKLVDTYTDQQIKMLNFIAYYIFIPIIIITIIVAWVLVGFGMISWEAGFWYTVFVVTMLMMFKVGFSIHAQSFIKKRSQALVDDVNASQADFENAIAYFPAAGYAVACAVNGDCWNCDCKTCSNEDGGCGPCKKKRQSDHDDDDSDDDDRVQHGKHHGQGNRSKKWKY